MDPEEQLEVLARIWGTPPEGDEYVFMPWIPAKLASSENKDERKGGWVEGPREVFLWPRDKNKIRAHLQRHRDDDLYFTPNRFLDSKRQRHLSTEEEALWADLDEADPRVGHAQEYKPTIAWQSSTGRFQAVWLIKNRAALIGASERGGTNHRLTAYIGADDSGWDTTQLLRVPGSFNNKHGKGERGELLWMKGPAYSWDDFEELPDVVRTEGEIDESLVTERDLEHFDWLALMARVKYPMPNWRWTKDQLRAEKVEKGDTEDRDSTLYSMARNLADGGFTALEIIALLRPCGWNKYEGRRDELIRLATMVNRAIAAKPDEVVAAAGPTDMSFGSALQRIASGRVKPPEWLVDGLWTVGGCGWVGAAPKSYKSWSVMDMAVAVASGQPWLNRIVKQKPVLYVQAEDPDDLVNDRLERIVDGSYPHLHPNGQVVFEDGLPVWEPPRGTFIPLELRTGSDFIASQPESLEWLEQMVIENQVGLVVIDTLYATIGELDTREGERMMSRLLSPLKNMARAHNCAVLIVHHNKKSAKDETRMAAGLSGNVALHGWADCGLYFHERDEQNKSVTFEAESKRGTTKVTMDIATLDEDRYLDDDFRHISNPSLRRKQRQRSVWVAWEREDRTHQDIPEPEELGPATPPKKGRPKGGGGQKLTKQLAAMGVREDKGRDWNLLRDTLGMQSTQFRTQVNAAIENGLIRVEDELIYLA